MTELQVSKWLVRSGAAIVVGLALLGCSWAADDEAEWHDITVRNAGFQEPGGDSQTLYVFAADDWTFGGEDGSDGGTMQWGTGNWHAFVNASTSQNENYIQQELDHTLVAGSYLVSVLASGNDVEGSVSRLSVGYLVTDAFTELAYDECIPAAHVPGEDAEWRNQTLSVTLMPEDTEALGKLMCIRLSSAGETSNTWGEFLNYWDDVRVAHRD